MKADKIQFTPQSKPVAFNGRIIYKTNKASKTLDAALKNFYYFEELAQDNDVVVRVARKTVKMFDVYHSIGEKLYKVSVSILKENSLADRVKDALHLVKRQPLTNAYHSENGTIYHLDSRTHRYVKTKTK